jgi:hypothetical protein
MGAFLGGAVRAAWRQRPELNVIPELLQHARVTRDLLSVIKPGGLAGFSDIDA